MSPRIAHITLIMQDVPGVAKKLESQAQVCKESGISIDFYWLTREGALRDEDYKYLKLESFNIGSAVKLRIAQVKRMNELAEQYDKVILRYPLFDPFIFALYKGKFKTILEHHAFELEELKLVKSKRYLLEKFFAPCFMRRFLALTAVTEEIVDYEVLRANFKGQRALVPNAIRLSDETLEGGLFQREQVQLAFVCSYFYEWHGLDLLLEGLESQICDDFHIHLVGEMPVALLDKAKQLKDSITIHGSKGFEESQEIVRSCDLGISCLALKRKGLKEASALKVREYLANGLPVVLTYREAAFPQDFPYLLQMDKIDFDKLRAFVKKHKGLAKNEVKKASYRYIDAEQVNRNLYYFCRNL